jgi:hypothetical protein
MCPGSHFFYPVNIDHNWSSRLHLMVTASVANGAAKTQAPLSQTIQLIFLKIAVYANKFRIKL